jgi:hypothetical protein
VKQDRFLMAILVAIGLIAALAVAIFFLRQSRLDYGPEDTPSGVVHNYLLALQKEDYKRAYGYLQEAQGKQELESFRMAFLTRQLDISNVAVQIGEVNQTGREAVVNLTLIHSSNDPFGEVWRENSQALLAQNEAGEWKIVNMPYPYWGYDWYQQRENSVPPKPAPYP